MKILGYEAYLDGGTIEILTDEGSFCYDGRIRSTTKESWYLGYPEKDNSNLISEKNYNLFEIRLIVLLKEYNKTSHDVYKNSIDWLIENLENKNRPIIMP